MKPRNAPLVGITVIAAVLLLSSSSQASSDNVFSSFDPGQFDGETIVAVPGILKSSPEVRGKLIEIGRALGTPHDSLAVVIEHESKWDPTIQAKAGDSGLIQLTRFANLPGFKTQAQVSSILNRGAVWQLEHVVFSYFTRFSPSILHNASPSTLFLANGFPSALNKPDSHLLGVKDETDPATGKLTARGLLYSRIPSYDRDKKGTITVGDARAEANSSLATAKGRRVTVMGQII